MLTTGRFLIGSLVRLSARRVRILRLSQGFLGWTPIEGAFQTISIFASPISTSRDAVSRRTIRLSVTDLVRDKLGLIEAC